MKILFLPSWYPTETFPHAGTFFQEQAQALRRAGHKVTLLYIPFVATRKLLQTKLYQVREVDEDGVHTYLYSVPSWGADRRGRVCERYAASLRLALPYILRREGPFDVVHAHSFLGAGYAAWRQKTMIGAPLVVTEHISNIPTGTLTKRQTIRLRQTVEGADAFLCVSRNLADTVCKITGYSGSLTVVPNILNPLFTYAPHSPKKPVFRFISIGGLIERKQMDLLIRAFAKTFSGNPTVKLSIAGRGPEEECLRSLARSEQVEGQVEFLGNLSREQVKGQLRKSHTFVMVSRAETFGVVYIEAMACGLPVIGTLNGGSNDVLHCYGATSIEVGNEQQLCNALKMAYEMYDSYDFERISQQALASYSEATVVSQLNQIYEMVLLKNAGLMHG